MKQRSSKQISAGAVPNVVECPSCAGTGYFNGITGRSVCNACHGSGFSAPDIADADAAEAAIMVALGERVRKQNQQMETMRSLMALHAEAAASAKAQVKLLRNRQPLAIRAFDDLVATGQLLHTDAIDASKDDIRASIEHARELESMVREQCNGITQSPRHFLLRHGDPKNGDIEEWAVEVDTYGS